MPYTDYTYDLTKVGARTRRNSKVMRKWSTENPLITNPRKSRITLNISGERFETYEETLERFPKTLLGSREKRCRYYNPEKCEYYIPRDKASFDCILFYYQSHGMLTQPDEQFVPEDVFRREVSFYELGKAAQRQLPLDFDVDFDIKSDKVAPDEGPVVRIWHVLDNPTSSLHGKIIGVWFIFTMVLFLVVKVLETLPELRQMYRVQFCCEQAINSTSHNMLADNNNNIAQIWFFFGLSCSLCLCLEFLARLITAPEKLKYFFFSLGMIDFLSFAPQFVLVAIDSSSLLSPYHHPLRNFLKFLPFVCVLKVYRYSTGIQIFWKSIRSSLSELGLLFYCLLISVILFGSLIFYCEEGLGVFTSIPASFWYAVITMTTVGYGDMVTVTFMGKVFSVCCAIIGVTSLLALPTTVVVNNFNKYYQSKQRRIKELKDQEHEEHEQND